MTADNQNRNHPETQTRESFAAEERDRDKSGFWKIIFLSFFLAFLMSSLAGSFYFLGKKTGVPGLEIGRETVIREEVAVERIRKAAKFISVEYHMSDVIEYRDDRLIPLFNDFLNILDKRVLIIAKAKVLAGFDLDKGIQIRVESSALHPRADVYITLPPAEIISVEPDYRYYDIQGSIPPDLHTTLLLRAKNTLRRAAVKEGILKKAEESMRAGLPCFFPSANVHIYFSRQTEKWQKEKEAEE